MQVTLSKSHTLTPMERREVNQYGADCAGSRISCPTVQPVGNFPCDDSRPERYSVLGQGSFVMCERHAQYMRKPVGSCDSEFCLDQPVFVVEVNTDQPGRGLLYCTQHTTELVAGGIVRSMKGYTIHTP